MKKKNPTVKQILDHVRKNILTSSRKWTKSRSAADHTGQYVRPEDPRACKFCVSGAVSRAVCDLCSLPLVMGSFGVMSNDQALFNRNYTKTMRRLDAVSKQVTTCHDVVTYNDTERTRFKDIKKLLDLAAKKPRR